MDMKANKKLIQAKINDEPGKTVTLKVLSNINNTGSNKKMPIGFGFD